MAIQNRRGNYTDFDPTKMVAGEFAVVQNGDPDGTDGEAVYFAPKAGKAKRLVTADDVRNVISGELEDIIAETEAALADDVQRAEDAADSVASSVTQIATNTADIADIKEDLEQKTGLSEEAKIALLDCFEHVAWIDEHGQTYYDSLYDALYPDTGLDHITAVFTQGSLVVYPSTPLGDLKPYLTVTGYYKDGTSGIITDYALSGTLEVGTSVITTTKDEKTATFNVTVTQDPTLVYELPSGTDISSTPIDTGISIFGPNDDFTILAKASITSIPSDTLAKYLVNHGSVSTGTLRLGVAHNDTNLVFTTNIMNGFGTVSVLADECDVWWVIRVRDKHALRMLYVDGNRLVYDADVDISSYLDSKTFTGTYKISTYSTLTDYNGCFPGVVNMLRIYNVALQDSDIERIMGIEM